jgi:hypothetical protein
MAVASHQFAEHVGRMTSACRVRPTLDGDGAPHISRSAEVEATPVLCDTAFLWPCCQIASRRVPALKNLDAMVLKDRDA